MAKSIQSVINAFWQGKPKKVSNTETDGSNLYLFGNCIAKWSLNRIWITSAGWKTVTTRDRLQILGANLHVKKGIWYLNDVEWNGDWIQIDDIPQTTEKLKTKTSIYE